MLKPSVEEMINAGFVGVGITLKVNEAIEAEVLTHTEATIAIAAALCCQVGAMQHIEILDATGFTVKVANLVIKLAYEQAQPTPPPSNN